MQFLLLVSTLTLTLQVLASNSHNQIRSPDYHLRERYIELENRLPSSRDNIIDEPVRIVKRKKTCKNKKKKSTSANNVSKVAVKETKDDDNSKNKSDGNSSKDDSASGSTFKGVGKGLFGMKFASPCQPNASDKTPNGSEEFLNCGIDGNGWQPPNVKFEDLKMLSAKEAAEAPVFTPCKQYAWAFQSVEKSTGIPAVLLMAFAMQESSCNAGTVGGNGEQGLMQITPDKCGGAPKGDCKDVYFNINKGASYFKSVMNDNKGNVLASMGAYNGWYPSLTVAKATQAAKDGNCHAQNNLDYLYQMVNGWLLGKDGYQLGGKYNNLAKCAD